MRELHMLIKNYKVFVILFKNSIITIKDFKYVLPNRTLNFH